MNKEFDIQQFNKDFDSNDNQLEKYKEKEPQFITQKQYHQDKNYIEDNIRKMKITFDFILLKISNFNNPIPYILENDTLTVGTINLLFFFGALNLILSGLLKN